MKRVLMISPHFPPDATAGAHRVRVLAPYLPAHGWAPTVLTVDPRDYEGELDEELASRTPPALRVIRVRAWPAAATRRMGVGDLGLRALANLGRAARTELEGGGYSAIYITTYPVYPAWLGPRLKRRFPLPFVLDLQDPWVSEWGHSVGPAGAPDLKSRTSRVLAQRLERAVLPHADALTSVSTALLDELAGRYPVLAPRPRLAMPIGIDPADIEWVTAHPRTGLAASGQATDMLRLAYVGTVLPLGIDTWRALLTAMSEVAEQPRGRALQLTCVGTSNEARPGAAARVLPIARPIGVASLIDERPSRVPFLDALRAVMAADVVVVLGTSEARYTASKLQIALAAKRSVLAFVHEASDVARWLAPIAARDRAVRLVTYSERSPPLTRVPCIREMLGEWQIAPPAPRSETGLDDHHLAPGLARRLAGLLDDVTTRA